MDACRGLPIRRLAPPSLLAYTGPIASPAQPELHRSLTLRGAVTLNMLDMIGVGPFITLPLLLAAMGGPQAMLGWIFGAILALCDGLVWAELGAAIPAAGGTYAFLRKIYPGRLGRLLSFLFVFQLLFSAPLSVASGCIGLGQYATWLVPSLAAGGTQHILHLAGYTAGLAISPATGIAIAAVILAVALLYRNLANIRIVSYILWITVITTIAWILITGLLHGHLAQAFTFPPGAFHLSRAFLAGLASAMLIATYDFWGYYNIAFLGAEVKDPGRTIPRAILLSIVLVAALYLAMNVAVLAVLPWQQLVAAQNMDARRAVISVFMQTAYGPTLGPLLGKLAAVLVIITAFASVFSLLLGYSRIPYAAARDGSFFRAFARLHPKEHFPHISLLTLGAAAALFCFFSLADVIAALVVLRIVLQFSMQHIGVMHLRRTQPNLPRPFRLWLYPLPPILALLGFAYILFVRSNSARELALTAILTAFGTAIFFLRRSGSASTGDVGA